MNANQFLQTSRTITFLIQKHKKTVPSFESWYSRSVIDPWKSDVVMTWAKDSRNKIEKQGDIDYFSSVQAKIVISYFHREDVIVTHKDGSEPLWIDIDRMVKTIKKKMTIEAFENSVLRIERKWAANSLPEWELLHAFSYIYAQQYRVCASLQSLLNQEINEEIPQPSEIGLRTEKSREVVYISLMDGEVNRFHHQRIMLDPDFDMEDGELATDLAKLRMENGTIEGSLSFHAALTQSMFELNGVYYPSIFMYDECGKCIFNGGTEFTGQASKHMFWRFIGEQVRSLSPTIVVWSSEHWIRDYTDENPRILFRDREIIGERLSVTVIGKNITAGEVHWKITRDDEGLVSLGERSTNLNRSDILRNNNIIAPVVEAFVRLSENRD
jgi:hypothetical protein